MTPLPIVCLVHVLPPSEDARTTPPWQMPPEQLSPPTKIQPPTPSTAWYSSLASSCSVVHVPSPVECTTPCPPTAQTSLALDPQIALTGSGRPLDSTIH